MRHTWIPLDKPYQIARSEKFCDCGAHSTGPSHYADGTYAGFENECPTSTPCRCGNEGCPSLNKRSLFKDIKILITGTCGFICSNLIRTLLNKYSDISIIGIDRLDEKCNIDNIYKHKNYKLYVGDICNEQFIDRIFDIERPSIVINAAAKSFVGSSLESPLPFIQSNVVGTQVLVNSSVKYKVNKFIQFSTDEVFGQLTNIKEESWNENSPKNARNPYACSKLASELIIKSTYETFGLPYNIIRPCNNYGIMQNTRNLIPKILTCLINDDFIPIQGEGKEIREFINVEDTILAITTIIEKAPLNEDYNIGTGFEMSNFTTAATIAKILNKNPKIKFVENRKCNDFRYSINSNKIKSLGWSPKVSFENGIKESFNWYKNNPNYCK